MSRPSDLSLSAIAAHLRQDDRAVTASSLAEHCLACQAAAAPLLHAYISTSRDEVLRAAAAADTAFAEHADVGLLQGIPVSVKDLFGLRGHPTYAGTAKRLGGRCEEDGPIVAGLRSQLAVFMGKTHTVELAFGGLGTNPHHGTPRNPWQAKEHRVPGGSSAGAAVSIVEGSALVALGTDTGGSVRIPAAMTGCVGLKTTQGRWSLGGVFPLSPSLDTVGVLTRTVADAAYAFAAIERESAGCPRRSPRLIGPSALASVAGLRIGVAERFFFADCSPGVAEAVEGALAELEQAGAKLVPVDLVQAEEAFAWFCRGGLAAAECFAYLSHNHPELIDLLEPRVGERVRDGATLSASDYLHRRARLAELGQQAALSLAGIDFLATPTVVLSPPTVEELRSEENYRRANRLALRNTSIVNLLGLCALSLPAGRDALGLPVGLHLIGRPNGEEALLAAAQAVEHCLGAAPERLGRPPLVTWL